MLNVVCVVVSCFREMQINKSNKKTAWLASLVEEEWHRQWPEALFILVSHDITVVL